MYLSLTVEAIYLTSPATLIWTFSLRSNPTNLDQFSKPPWVPNFYALSVPGPLPRSSTRHGRHLIHVLQRSGLRVPRLCTVRAAGSFGLLDDAPASESIQRSRVAQASSRGSPRVHPEPVRSDRAAPRARSCQTRRWVGQRTILQYCTAASCESVTSQWPCQWKQRCWRLSFANSVAQPAVDVDEPIALPATVRSVSRRAGYLYSTPIQPGCDSTPWICPAGGMQQLVDPLGVGDLFSMILYRPRHRVR